MGRLPRVDISRSWTVHKEEVLPLQRHQEQTCLPGLRWGGELKAGEASLIGIRRDKEEVPSTSEGQLWLHRQVSQHWRKNGGIQCGQVCGDPNSLFKDKRNSDISDVELHKHPDSPPSQGRREHHDRNSSIQTISQHKPNPLQSKRSNAIEVPVFIKWFHQRSQNNVPAWR